MRQIPLLLCFATGVWLLWSLVREIRVNLTILRSWKHEAAVVTGTADERAVEVAVGDLANTDRLNIPVHPAAVYSNWDHVTLLSNPADPAERRLTGLFDLWYPALRRLLALALVVATAAIASNIKIGYSEVWSRGQWIAVNSPAFLAEWAVTVRPPGNAWKANLLWGAILGGSLLFGAVFLGSERHQLVRIFTGWLGLMFLLAMTRQSIENYTAELHANQELIERRCLWGAQRASWSDVARVELVDQGAKLEQLRGLDAQGRMKPTNNAVPSIRQWIFADRENREIFRMSHDFRPPDQVRKMLVLAGTRTPRD